jgi:hypothetical protein
MNDLVCKFTKNEAKFYSKSQENTYKDWLLVLGGDNSVIFPQKLEYKSTMEKRLPPWMEYS